MEYIRSFAQNYQVPNFQRLWHGGSDAPDGTTPPPKSIYVQLESVLVQFQELLLWTDPSRSSLALVALHCFFFYLYITTNTVINLTLWALLSGFLYTTWTQTIWPEIRVKQPDETFTQVNPSCYSGPEVEAMAQTLKDKARQALDRLKLMRSDTPGRFCLVICAILSVVAYIGSVVNTLALLYGVLMSLFIVPTVMQQYLKDPGSMPWVQAAVGKTGAFLETIGLGPTPEDVPDHGAVIEPEVQTQVQRLLGSSAVEVATSYLHSLQAKVQEVMKEPRPEEELYPHENAENQELLQLAEENLEADSKLVVAEGPSEDSLLPSLDAIPSHDDVEEGSEPHSLQEEEDEFLPTVAGSAITQVARSEDQIPRTTVPFMHGLVHGNQLEEGHVPDFSSDEEHESLPMSESFHAKPHSLEEVSKTQAVMLSQAMREDSIPESSSSDGSKEEEFELITEEELKNVDI
eukprot:maker-scaffold1273_size51358-snap-gene-0.7 protein:Tk12555 transcript:maker-scaffold1273_size51358-snap-gene-0.7-mRNA-1 annotation:"hypothetical protein LOTGIDRAFT_237816"